MCLPPNPQHIHLRRESTWATEKKRLGRRHTLLKKLNIILGKQPLNTLSNTEIDISKMEHDFFLNYSETHQMS